MKRKTTLILIVGTSGSGKTYMSRYLEKEWQIPAIVSYTTRPMRTGEVDGVDHYFVDHQFYETVDKNEMLAYTKFGDHYYFTVKWQTEDCPTYSYVVDEDGIRFFLDRFADEYNIVPVYVHASEETRRSRGIDQARIDRDLKRVHLPINTYQSVINNDGELEDFEQDINSFMNQTNAKYCFI